MMVYDAFAHLPIYALEALGFSARARAGRSSREAHSPRRQLPLNTNGGGLSYTHTGMYGMYALQECVRQLRGVAPAQVPTRISLAHGVGGMFAAAGTIILTNDEGA